MISPRSDKIKYIARGQTSKIIIYIYRKNSNIEFTCAGRRLSRAIKTADKLAPLPSNDVYNISLARSKNTRVRYRVSTVDRVNRIRWLRPWSSIKVIKNIHERESGMSLRGGRVPKEQIFKSHAFLEFSLRNSGSQSFNPWFVGVVVKWFDTA